MTKTLITGLAFLIMTASANATSDSYRYAKGGTVVELKGDSLIIENGMMKRTWQWNNGNLITRSLTDKSNGVVWKTGNKTPDLHLPGESDQATEGDIRAEEVAESNQFTQQVRVTVSYRAGGLFIKKVIKVYPNCPVLATEIYLKGKAARQWVRELKNPADLQNIEKLSAQMQGNQVPVLEQLSMGGRHWQLEAIEFFDITDRFNTLVHPSRALSYTDCLYRGNLLFAENAEKDAGIFMLKEAPTSNVQLAYPNGDFLTNGGAFQMIGIGVDSADVKTDEWTRAYGYATGVYRSNEKEKLLALRNYQMHIRPSLKERDEMVMLNTWGDRGQDRHINEAFCMRELENAAKLGITHFQLDAGWQTGRGAGSAFGGSFKDIWKNALYWTPDTAKFPNGLASVMQRGKELGVEVCLWFNPSFQDENKDWEKDAEALISLYNKYGIRTFKIDGTAIPTKLAEIRLRKLYDRVMEATHWNAILNLDATAGRRGGYFFFNEYGNIFLENRYTDWKNYYPYWTLRNLWMLSRYLPPQNLQIEFLNKWRNTKNYEGDIFGPANYSFDYLFAITMFAQPLAWFEASCLPQEALTTGKLIKTYKTVQHDIHTGAILPIGDEPSGESWCGFQSIKEGRGYIVVYRENNPKAAASIKTYLNAGDNVEFTPVAGMAKRFTVRVGNGGEVPFSLQGKNSFALYSYRILRKK